MPPQPVQPSSLQILVLKMVVIFSNNDNNDDDGGDDNNDNDDDDSMIKLILPSHVNIRSTPKRESCHNSLKRVTLEKDQSIWKRRNENWKRINVKNGKRFRFLLITHVFHIVAVATSIPVSSLAILV